LHNSKKRNLPEFLSSLESINESVDRGELSAKDGITSKIKAVGVSPAKKMKMNDQVDAGDRNKEIKLNESVKSHPAFKTAKIQELVESVHKVAKHLPHSALGQKVSKHNETQVLVN